LDRDRQIGCQLWFSDYARQSKKGRLRGFGQTIASRETGRMSLLLFFALHNEQCSTFVRPVHSKFSVIVPSNSTSLWVSRYLHFRQLHSPCFHSSWNLLETINDHNFSAMHHNLFEKHYDLYVFHLTCNHIPVIQSCQLETLPIASGFSIQINILLSLITPLSLATTTWLHPMTTTTWLHAMTTTSTIS
jgi:hypothetical protein